MPVNVVSSCVQFTNLDNENTSNIVERYKFKVRDIQMDYPKIQPNNDSLITDAVNVQCIVNQIMQVVQMRLRFCPGRLKFTKNVG